MENWLDTLIMHEAHYFGFCADSERTPFALFLHGPDIPDYRDANRALRLRDDGRGPDAIAAEVIAYYRSRGLAVAADIDAPAEAQGIGAALRKRGCTPVSGDTLLMRYAAQSPPAMQPRGTEVLIREENHAGLTQIWAETVLSDFQDDRAPMWRAVIEREAVYAPCRHYLGMRRDEPAGRV